MQALLSASALARARRTARSAPGGTGLRHLAALWVAVLAGLLSAGVGQAAAQISEADVASNEHITEPFGPLTGGATYRGTISSLNDVDWLLFFVNGANKSVDVAVTNTGGPSPRKPHMWQTGLRRAPFATPNGSTAGEWLCTTAITSGRAL